MIFFYIGARRIPADRYVMFDNDLRAHEADKLFLAIFLFFSSLLGIFFYGFYWFLSEPATGVAFLLILLGTSIWEQRSRYPPRAMSDRHIIILVGVAIPLLIFLLYILFSPFFFSGGNMPTVEEYWGLFLASLYLLAGTTMWITWRLRNPPPSKPGWLLRYAISILLFGGLLALDRWWGLGASVLLSGLWLALRRRLLPRATFIHAAPPVLYLATFVSLVLLLAPDSRLPIGLNLIGYVGITALCLWWAYQKEPMP